MCDDYVRIGYQWTVLLLNIVLVSRQQKLSN